jgi:hypothetical protein
VVLIVLRPGAARGGDVHESSVGGTVLNEQMAKEAAEFAAARRLFREIPCDPKVEVTTVVIPLPRMDGQKIARELERTYRRRPGFVVATLPSLGIMVIRADAATIKEALTFVSAMSVRANR